MNDCERLVEELAELMIYLKNALDEQYEISLNDCFFRELAYQMVANGVTFATDKNDGGKWIPVTERLPDCECIAVGNNNEMLIGWVAADENSNTGYYAESGGEILVNVTHWMPLPEPPEGD